MNKLIIDIRGDSGSQYSIELIKKDNKLHTYCSCSAGLFRKHCKHVMDVLAGDYKRIEDKDQIEQLKTFMSDVNELPKLSEVAARIAELEKQVKALNKLKSAEKTKIDDFIKNGFEFSE